MRWLFRIFFGLLALAGLAVAVLFLLPADRIAKVATDRFEAATGRAMTLQGDVRPTLWPELGVNTGRVTIANAAWSDAGPMLQADGLSIGVDIGALFGGTIRITRVEADAPKIVLEVARDGRANWDMAGAASDAPSSGGASGAVPAFTLDQAVIRDAAISYIDHAAGSRTDLSDIDATLQLPDFQGAADIELSASMNGQRADLTATVGAFAAFLAKGAVPVNATATVGGATVGFDGRAGLQPLQAGGRIDADLKDMGSLFRLIGQTAPALPRGFGQSIGVTGDLTLTDAGRITLRDGTIRLDQNTLTGAADISLGDRIRVTAQLNAGALDFSSLAADGGGADTGGQGGSGWSRDPIDASGLQAIDAEIALAADSIDLGLAQLGRTRTLTQLDTGRAVTQVKEVNAYGGTLAGTVVVNSRGGLSARADLKGDAIALQPLLQQMAGYDRLLANGNVAINLLGSGGSLHALMNSLSGNGSVKLGKGELRGLDLVGMLRNLDTSFTGAGAKTIFDSISATFQVENGVLVNSDLVFSAPLLKATGTGKIGIGAQTLDYRLVPTLLEGTAGKGLKVPLMITGTWANPKFKLDLKALAEQELSGEVEELKSRAETAVKEKLSEELGVQVDTLENVDEVLKQELEDRARKGLLDLLGGNR